MRGSSGYAPVSDAAEPARTLSRRSVAAALTAAVAASAATAAWLGRGARRLRMQPDSAIEAKFGQGPSQCGKLEQNVEYVVEGGWYSHLDHIPSPEMCCALCQGEPKCMSFTWVKNAGLGGCPSQCWLKGGAPQRTQGKQGVVSGLPPARKQFNGAPAAPGSPTLNCFSLMVPSGGEPRLLAWQAEHQASIFACDATTIYSNQQLQVGSYWTHIVDSDLKCKFGGDSQSALNSWIFIAVWKAVIDDGTYKSYDYTVKCDPDAAFFPDRMKRILAPHAGAPYVNNCRYGMHGPIEVFGKAAIERLAQDYQSSADGKAPRECVEKLHFGQWGEDMFMNQCLSQVYGLSAPLEPRLMCEDHCDCPSWYWCGPGDTASYHPFKTVEAYANCMANALGGAAPAGPAAAGAPAADPTATAYAAAAAAPEMPDPGAAAYPAAATPANAAYTAA